MGCDSLILKPLAVQEQQSEAVRPVTSMQDQTGNWKEAGALRIRASPIRSVLVMQHACKQS